MKIAEAASDERGALAHGKKGDQTGNEVRIREMTGKETGSGTFTLILRYPDKKKRAGFAKDAKEIALNDYYGYAQYGPDDDPYAGRYGIWTVMHREDFTDFAKMQIFANTDCSQMTCCALNHNGIAAPPTMRTATEVAQLEALGFIQYPYTVGSCVLGDVVWRQGHTAIVVEAPEGEGAEVMFSAKLTSSKDTRIWSTGAGPKTRACPYIKIKKAEIGFTPGVIVVEQLGEILANSQWVRGQAHLYCANYQNDASAGIAVGKASSYFNPDATEIIIPVRFAEREHIVRIYP